MNKLLFALIVLVSVLSLPAKADHNRFYFGVQFGAYYPVAPAYVVAAPVYVAPAPVYYVPPAPVYVAPAPVYYPPMYTPAPVYYYGYTSSIRFGYGHYGYGDIQRTDIGGAAVTVSSKNLHRVGAVVVVIVAGVFEIARAEIGFGKGCAPADTCPIQSQVAARGINTYRKGAIRGKAVRVGRGQLGVVDYDVCAEGGIAGMADT